MEPKEEVIMKSVCTTTVKLFVRQLALLLLVTAFVWSCGASRQNTDYGEDSLDIDDLISEDTTEQKQGSDEAEVLKLLGITPDESQAQEAVASTTTEPPAVDDLEADIDQLKQELLQKDREIYELRSELTKKEMKISELETQPSSTSTQEQSQARISPADYKTKYQFALDQFRARKYEEALSLFRELVATDPNHDLADNCQYWIGECYYGQGKYNQAIAEFEKVFSYPHSNKNDDAQLKLGICYVKLGERTQARAEFDRLLSIYPDSEYKNLAQKYLARL